MLSAKRLDTVFSKAVTLNYLHYEPAEATGPAPLVLFLHGSGERGSDLDAVKREGVPRLLAEGRGFPFAVVAPQCPDGLRWIDLLDDLGVLLDAVVTDEVDPDRVYLVGMSMGAQGAWNLAATAKERFAALVCVSGFAAPWRARDLTGLPIWAFHGEADRAVPFAESEMMVAWLEREGADVTFTRLPGVDHDAWTPAFAMPELYSWLLEQRRG